MACGEKKNRVKNMLATSWTTKGRKRQKIFFVLSLTIFIVALICLLSLDKCFSSVLFGCHKQRVWGICVLGKHMNEIAGCQNNLMSAKSHLTARITYEILIECTEFITGISFLFGEKTRASKTAPNLVEFQFWHNIMAIMQFSHRCRWKIPSTLW